MTRGALIGAALVAAAVACGSDARRAADAGVLDTSLAPPAAPPAAPLPPLSEEAVQAVVDAVNAADAQLSGLAIGKAANDDVKRFASRIASAHRQKVTDRAPPTAEGAATALVAPLRDLQAAAAPRLAALPAGPAFDRAWVELQIDVHQRALAILDRIAPAAQAAARAGALPALVATTRDRVAEHLNEARGLQVRLR